MPHSPRRPTTLAFLLALALLVPCTAAFAAEAPMDGCAPALATSAASAELPADGELSLEQVLGLQAQAEERTCCTQQDRYDCFSTCPEGCLCQTVCLQWYGCQCQLSCY